MTVSLIIIFFVSNKFLLNNAISSKIFNKHHYSLSNPSALSGRIGLWRGVLVTLNQPLNLYIGYGYGWKKLSLIASKDEYGKIVCYSLIM